MHTSVCYVIEGEIFRLNEFGDSLFPCISHKTDEQKHFKKSRVMFLKVGKTRFEPRAHGQPFLWRHKVTKVLHSASSSIFILLLGAYHSVSSVTATQEIFVE